MPTGTAGTTPRTVAPATRSGALGRVAAVQWQSVQPSVWVWHWGTPQPLLALARLHGAKRLFVSVSPGISHNPAELARLTALKALATQQGVHLDALSGDTSWAVVPARAGAWVATR